MMKKIVFMTALLCIVLLPAIAWAAPVVDIPVEIEYEDEEVSAIKAKIDAAFTGLELFDGGTVTVTGKRTAVDNTDGQLVLEIPENVTVVWQAEYDGYVDGGLINISGAGTFEVTTGGTVSASGGTETAIAIVVNDGGTVTVTGGTVEAGNESSAVAIEVVNGTVKVTGGTVTAEISGGPGISINISEYGTAAYLKGTITAGKNIEDSAEIGVIVEVSSLHIPASWHGTSIGLDIIKDYPEDEWSVAWNIEGNVAKIVFFRDGDPEEWLLWGPAQGDDGGGSCGCNAGVGFLVLALVGSVPFIFKRQ